MDFLYTGLATHVFFILSIVCVIGIVSYAYIRNDFPSRIAWTVLVLIVGYVSSFLFYRYTTGHMEAHAAREPLYSVFAAVHGTISLVAIFLTAATFFFAARAQAQGRSFFRTHSFWVAALPVLWVASLVSGLFI